MNVLDRVYMKDQRVNRMMNIEQYYKIERKLGEMVKEYIERYKHVGLKCKEEGGGDLLEGMVLVRTSRIG